MVQCEQCSACLWPRFPYSGIPAAARGLGFPLISRRGSHWPSAFFKALMELNLFSLFPPDCLLLLCPVNQEGRESILMPLGLFSFSGEANCP